MASKRKQLGTSWPGADNGALMSARYCDYEGYSLMCAYCGGRLVGQYAVETIDA